jgi:glutathione S-transferase
MNAPRETFELTMSRFIRAPREKVFDAFVTPSLMAAWQCPRGMQAEATTDARVGGAYRVDMRARDGSRFAVGGRYVEIKRPERLAYTWQWEGDNSPMPGVETLIEVDFSSRDDGTELRMRHSGFPSAQVRDAHTHGWGGCFNKLTDLLDPRGTAATLTLLGDPRSTYVRTARMAFAEKGVAYTLQPCAPHSPELLAVHPFGRMPALKDGETTVWETAAIVKYIDESFGDELLFTPGRIGERVACEQWVSAINGYCYDTMVRRYLLQYAFPKGEGGQPDRVVIDKAVPEMAMQLQLLERSYERSPFLAGSTLTLADLLIAPILAYVEKMPEGQRLLSDMPHTRRAQAALRERPSFAATEPQTR